MPSQSPTGRKPHGSVSGNVTGMRKLSAGVTKGLTGSTTKPTIRRPSLLQAAHRPKAIIPPSALPSPTKMAPVVSPPGETPPISPPVTNLTSLLVDASTSPRGEAPASPAKTSAREDGQQDGGTVDVWTDSYKQGKLQMAALVVKLRNRSLVRPGVPTISDAELSTRYRSVRAFLWHLEFEAVLTPNLKESLDQGLKLLYDKQLQGLIPDDISRLAKMIHAKFEQENWGADSTNMGDEMPSENERDPLPQSPTTPASPNLSTSTTTSTTTRRASSSSNGTGGNGTGTSIVHLPPASHPIWGINGIMHGIMMVRHKTQTSYQFNPRYITQKREAKVFGHNNLLPGAWWPLRHVALFHGAHSHSMRGISGSPTLGTYSIVVSGSSPIYSDLDQDLGATLYYSADSSFNNRDPSAISHVSNDTRSLQRSLTTRQPVRVLRSAGQHGKTYAPSVGIRYDGLYRAVEEVQAQNREGGLYYKFKLVRVAGQRSLAEICAAVPSVGQKDDEGRFRAGY